MIYSVLEINAVIANCDYRIKTIKNYSKMRRKSPQVVKHVVKCEKWACSTPKAGKNKPIMFIAKTRDFERFSEKIKEKRGFVMNPRFGLSDKT